MVKHNNVIPNQHFKKDWQRYVKTWFDQPAQKKIRRDRRIAKATKMAPRPTHNLKPVVRCPTNKYNTKLRAGRGFTLEEVRAAGLIPREARTIGISVDHRRRNKSDETFERNVKRLQEYKKRLVVFPKSGRKTPLDSSRDECAKGVQVFDREVIPIRERARSLGARAISPKESEDGVYGRMRWALMDEKRWGLREKKAKDKAAKVADKKRGGR